MSTTTINHIFDPIGNQANSRPKPELYWRYINMYRRYDVQIEWLHNNVIENSLSQQITMHCRHAQNEKAVWQVQKENFLINEQESENPVDELAIACLEQLYPMQLVVNKSSEIENILNIADIQEKFAAAMPILQRDFDGPIAEQYISQMKEGLSHPNSLLANIQQDKWFSLFFNPIYTTYDATTFDASMCIPFPFYDFEQPFFFTIQSKLTLPKAEIPHCVVHCFGDMDIDRVSNKTQHRYGLVAGSIDITYQLDLHKHQIEEITGSIIIETVAGIDQINVTGRNVYSEEKVEPIKIKQEKKKTSWWSSLFSE